MHGNFKKIRTKYFSQTSTTNMFVKKNKNNTLQQRILQTLKPHSS